MKVLGVDCSAVAASAAIWEDDVLLGEFFTNVKMTHSQTLMPMVQQLFASTGVTPRQLDCLAVSAGPGSFTGVRIGVSAVKGLGLALQKPCVGVSALAALAHQLRGMEQTVICPVMDARCNQFYNALFQWKHDKLVRLCDDRAVEAMELKKELKSLNFSVILVGDGAQLCYNMLKEDGLSLSLAPPLTRFPRAGSVAQLGAALAKTGFTVDAKSLQPIYLRLPQAERELKKKVSDQTC